MKKYYVFKGLNSTCGTPHPSTGLFNIYGDLIAFTSKVERDHFFDDYFDCNNHRLSLAKCSATTCRQFFLGMSVHQMREHIEMIVDAEADEVYNNWMHSPHH
tara:strand:+ start:864 stop:1169 length:306 start_codon:yes stop_codon:yes gene_type:complete